MQPSDESPARGALDRYERYVNPSLVRLMRFMGLDGVEWEGSGAILTDDQGRRYIDCASGFGVHFLGHRHPRIVAAVRKQLDLLPLSSRLLISEPAGTAAELLAEVAPGDLRYSFFCNSGAESVEAAIKFARIATGRIGIVSTVGAFHGKTLGALSASGRQQYKRPFEPLVPGFSHVPFGDVDAVDAAINEDTAAVLLEPIQGENGVVVPPKDYLRLVRALCDRRGVLMILDEVQTGMGRTGTMFACEQFGAAPDIMCLSKALGGGVVPIGATMGTARVWEFFDEAPLLHTSTFGGNPLCCAAAAETVRVIREEGLLEQARIKGEKCLVRMRELAVSYPQVLVEARGLGLLMGMEFASQGLGGCVMSGLLERGVLAVYTLNNQRVIRWAPSAIIEQADLDAALDALTESIVEAAAIASELGGDDDA